MATNSLFSRLKDSLGHSPVVANVVFAFLMAVTEKILVAEFACPCDPERNGSFAAAFFVIPACTSFLLMMVLYKCRGQNADSDKWWSCFLPPLVWQIIMFLDGQYLVCAMTDWPGTFYSVERTYLKWCEPTNGTKSEERKALSGEYFVKSQGIGFGLLIVLTVLLTVYVLMKCLKKTEDTDRPVRTCVIHGSSTAPLTPTHCELTVTVRQKEEQHEGHNRADDAPRSALVPGMPGGPTEPGIQLQPLFLGHAVSEE